MPYILPHVLFDWSLACSARMNQAVARINMARSTDPIDERELKLAESLQSAKDQQP